MNFSLQKIDAKSEVKTLNWLGDCLIDLASGGRLYELDGTITPSQLFWSGPAFDMCVTSPSGRYAVLCQRLGTKGLVIDLGKEQPRLLREINRSYYCSQAFEYPVTFVSHQKTEWLVHCPEDYNQLEIEDVESGVSALDPAKSKLRKSADFFHSHLEASPNGRYLISAGWVWHPFDTIAMYDLETVCSNPAVLDSITFPGLDDWGEVNSATFVDDATILVSENSSRVTYGEGDKTVARIRAISLTKEEIVGEFEIEFAAGTMMASGTEHVVSFYQHPKVYHLPTGRLIASWPEIRSGLDSSSINNHLERAPAIARDRQNQRFAVANGKEVLVVQAFP